MLLKNKIKISLLFLLILLGVLIIFILIQKPSLDRNWTQDQKVLAEISFSGTLIDIKNIRNLSYITANEYEVNYYDKLYNLDTLESVYYIIEPFWNYDWPAHTMLSFWFSDQSFLVVSAEIRKEVWDRFNPFLWIFNKYEMVYVVWDENDLVKLRANHRENNVYIYPIKLEKNKIKDLFLSVMKRADTLSKEPEFYNTITNTCATSILQHVNSVRESSGKNKIPWSQKVFLPSHSDEIAYNLWLIDTKLSLQEARKYYKINDLSEKYSHHEDYSLLIRKEKK